MVSKKQQILTFAVGLWVLATLGGLGGMMALGRRPDAPADERAQWPVALKSTRSMTGPTLLVCLHPLCPCSDATLDAVERVLSKYSDLTVIAVVAMPSDRVQWQDAELVSRCRKIKSLKTVIDTDGTDCRILGARASGQVLLYDAEGRLTFAGGLTPGRGETGHAAGQTLVDDVLAGRQTPTHTLRTPVFGCALYRRPMAEVAR